MLRVLFCSALLTALLDVGHAAAGPRSLVDDGALLGTQCSDGIDNGGNGWIDMADPYCRAPLDSDELSFGSGVGGDDMNFPQSLDCWFDFNTGPGDDDCQRHACCGIDGPCPADLHPELYVPENCPQSAQCLDFCAPLAREGCDCFGCCDVCAPGMTNCRTVYVHPAISPTCTLEGLDDPLVCRPCQRDAACAGPIVHLFSDGFETEDTSQWSAASPIS